MRSLCLRVSGAVAPSAPRPLRSRSLPQRLASLDFIAPIRSMFNEGAVRPSEAWGFAGGHAARELAVAPLPGGKHGPRAGRAHRLHPALAADAARALGVPFQLLGSMLRPANRGVSAPGEEQVIGSAFGRNWTSSGSGMAVKTKGLVVAGASIGETEHRGRHESKQFMASGPLGQPFTLPRCRLRLRRTRR